MTLVPAKTKLFADNCVLYGKVNTPKDPHTVESGLSSTSSIRRMSYSCLNSTLHSLSGAHNLIKRKMGGAGY